MGKKVNYKYTFYGAWVPAPIYLLGYIKQFHQTSLTLCTQRPYSGLSLEANSEGEEGVVELITI